MSLIFRIFFDEWNNGFGNFLNSLKKFSLVTISRLYFAHEAIDLRLVFTFHLKLILEYLF